MSDTPCAGGLGEALGIGVNYGRAVLRGEATAVVPYLAERHQRLGWVKAQRQRHRDRDALTQQIWGASALS